MFDKASNVYLAGWICDKCSQNIEVYNQVVCWIIQIKLNWILA